MTDKRKKSVTKGKDDNRSKKFVQSSDPIKAERQRKAIASYYAKKKNASGKIESKIDTSKSNQFPDKLPFWARLKINKHRTTLVIDREPAYNKQKKIMEDGFVHREATSVYKPGLETIVPNPDKTKKTPMYLKSPRKMPIRMFELHNKKLDMPKELKKRYDKNNRK